MKMVTIRDVVITSRLYSCILLLSIMIWRLFMLVLFLSVFLYILFFITLVLPQTRVVTIHQITSSLFDQLRLEHGETLSCPCSTTIVSYKEFVTNTISFHPLCSSIFVSEKWIEALNLPYASAFLMTDFRKTASSQVSELMSWRYQKKILSKYTVATKEIRCWYAITNFF
jgi:hypothetical protein